MCSGSPPTGSASILIAAPGHAAVKLDLLHRSVDIAMLALDTGPHRLAPW
jgi:hypothetical protein